MISFEINFFFVFIALHLFGCTAPESQNSFEGIIEYAYSYQGDSVNGDTLDAARATTGKMIYKGSKYKSVFIGKNTESYIYDNDTGLANFISSETDSIDCEDYTVQNDSILFFQIINTDEKILGEKVKILKFSSVYATHRFYFSLKHKVAPSNYDKHEAYNWKFYKEKADGGVLLKVEHIFKKMKMTGIATKLEARPVSAKEFEIDTSKLKAVCR